jgi:hypothetical protein
LQEKSWRDSAGREKISLCKILQFYHVCEVLKECTAWKNRQNCKQKKTTKHIAKRVPVEFQENLMKKICPDSPYL